MKKSIILSSVATFLFLTACQKEESESMFEPSNNDATLLRAEEAFPGKAGIKTEGFLHGVPIEYSNVNQMAVFQGDIILSREQLASIPKPDGGVNKKTEGTGRALEAYRWPDKTVYYTVDPALTRQERVFDAIAHWESETDIKFIQRTTQANYVTFGNDGGCYSYVGMIGGNQFISVGDGCSTGNTIHEIGHALGLWHEQSRVDRNGYIIIRFENIMPGYVHNFRTYSEQGLDGFDHGPFDFGSIMMYPYYAFSVNGQPTITKLDGSTFSVQRDALSPGDLSIIKTMYPASIDIHYVIEEFDNFASEGSLQGSGPGSSAANRLKTFKNMLINAKELIDMNDITEAHTQLSDAQKHIHTTAEVKPSHFVTGTKATVLYNMIEELKNLLASE